MQTNKIFKKIVSVMAVIALLFVFTACGNGDSQDSDAAQNGKTYKIGICNYADDASLNQIVANIEAQLQSLGQENNVTFEVETQNAMGDPTIMDQIIANLINDNVDLMVGVATPVAMAMQAATEDNQIPVVFSAVSNPVGSGVVASMEAPGANLTGTSDYLNTDAVMDLIFAADEQTDLVGLLYDPGQDSATAPIAAAKAYLDKKHVKYIERTGTTGDEVMLAAQALVSDGVDAVFTPTDNTIMQAELSIYEIFADAGVRHFGGADSFALNGAFVGYGVDYIQLGKETANMIADILINDVEPATMAVKTFDNGIATINTDVCAQLKLDFDQLKEAFAPYSSAVKPIKTAEEFE